MGGRATRSVCTSRSNRSVIAASSAVLSFMLMIALSECRADYHLGMAFGNDELTAGRGVASGRMGFDPKFGHRLAIPVPGSDEIRDPAREHLTAGAIGTHSRALYRVR